MSWPLVSIKSVSKVTTGKTPSKKVEEYFGGDIPFISPSELGDAPFVLNSKQTLTESGASKIKLVPKNSVLVCCIGSLGKLAIADRELGTNQQINSVTFDESKIDYKYGYYALSRLKPILESMAPATTVAIVNKSKFEELEIPLPPLDEQKRIAAILDKADAIRRKRQQAIRLADDFLRSVFLDMFGDPVTNPKGWEVKKLGELTTIRRGASPRPIANFMGGDVPWIKIGDGSKGDQVYLNSTKEHVTQEGASKSVFLAKGSLIFANCGVSLGFARILNIAGCIHDGWLSIENIDKGLNKIFILKWINQLTLYFRRIAPDGTQPNLNSGIMRDQEIILPPIEIQNKFEDVLLKHERALAKLNDGLVSANEALNSLSQKAFAGEL
mgnify:CR=1 FL=1